MLWAPQHQHSRKGLLLPLDVLQHVFRVPQTAWEQNSALLL